MRGDYIIAIGLLTIFTLGGVFYLFFGGNKIINETVVEVSGKSVQFNDSEIIQSLDDDINYYQAYIYPEDFVFSCINNETVCNNILEKKDKIKVYSLGLVGRSIDDTNKSLDLDIDLSFGNKKDNKQILKDIFSQLYLDNSITSEQDNDLDNRDNLNDISSTTRDLCVEGIKNSLPEGLSELDTTFRDKVELECKGLENINDLTLAFGGDISTQGEDSIRLELDISSLRISYVFYSKDKDQFIKKETEEKVINKNIQFSSKILLSDFQ